MGSGVKFKPAWVKKDQFSESEIAALKALANGEIVEPLRCQRLKTLGLVTQTRGGWALTQQGLIQLQFLAAR